MTEKVTKKALQILQSLVFDGSFNINKILIPFMLTKNEKPSVAKAMEGNITKLDFQRREWDSNPRYSVTRTTI